MNPIMWARKAIIPGINCLLLMKQSEQQVTDSSGLGNHFQLGNTAGADTNDPAYSNGGYAFSADDYIKGPLTINPEQDFTVYIVANVAASAPAANETYFSIGNSGAATQYFVIQRNTAGRIALAMINNAGSAVYPYIDAAQVIGGVRLLAVKRQSGTLFAKEVIAGTKGTSDNCPASPITCNQAAIGCVLRTSATSFLNRAVYALATVQRATTDAEDQQMLKYLRREMAVKGVVL